MRVLVTGGAGYIGSHTSKVLAQHGLEPIALDNLGQGHRSAVKWGPLETADLADTDTLRRILREHRIEAVIHFAASAYVGESMREPRGYFRNNLQNSLNLFGAMLDEGINFLIFSSTCATYGEPQNLPISEDHPQRPVNPYGESKLAVERILHWYRQAYGFQSIALRYFNAAGCDPDGEIGEVHTPETHLIPLLIRAAIDRQRPVDVFGTDYPTPDGTAVRDYIHVSDLATGHYLALKHLRGSGTTTALNLGNGRGHSVRDVIRTVEGVAGCAIPVRDQPRRQGDPAILVANANNAGEVLGWHPRYSDIQTIVRTAFEWERRRDLSSHRLQQSF